MRGIILAGGAGSRLHPLTQVVCKQLLPVYDKPMICYPLSLLMLNGVREVLIISTPKDTPQFEALLGSGEDLGMRFFYKVQERPTGLPDAFLIGEEFIGDQDVMMILGDNLFHGQLDFLRDAAERHRAQSGPRAQIFGLHVEEPSRFGVVEFDPKSKKAVSLVEKPTNPKSPFAIPGLYIFDQTVSKRARSLRPSPRGETEIVDLLKTYLEEDTLNVHLIPRGVSWFDAGTHESLLEVSNYISAVERRHGLKVGCLLEIAARRRYISLERLMSEIEKTPRSPFRDYLSNVYQQISMYPEDL